MLLGPISIIIGYLLGSIPTAYIMGKSRKGIDIREVDTRNMGAGSTFRQVGLWEGAVVALVDIGKGAAAILVAQAVGVSQPFVLAAGFAAILGHSFPFSIGFRGGQGVATIMGIFLVLAPEVMLVILGLMGVALLLTRHIFTMTCITAPFLPLLIWLFDKSAMFLFYSLVIIAFVVFRNRHRLKEFRLVANKNKR
ncbi:MAG: glycerol-3-phosphate acyltransferase [Dehalococcoidia bacterium]|nr:glycerol-3-phosphate acyltransferase [Dehalococcoidia bacterium]